MTTCNLYKRIQRPALSFTVKRDAFLPLSMAPVGLLECRLPAGKRVLRVFLLNYSTSPLLQHRVVTSPGH